IVLKAALAVSAPLTVIVHVFCPPVQAPLQPAKTPLEGGSAVSVTLVPPATVAKQEPPQLILAPVAVTVPLPVLVTMTDGTSTLAAAFCSPIISPNSPSEGAVQVPS